jgi:rubrerythrin
MPIVRRTRFLRASRARLPGREAGPMRRCPVCGTGLAGRESVCPRCTLPPLPRAR